MKPMKGSMFIGLFFLFFIFSLLVSSWTGASAADYPNRPITLVVAYAPGGVMDLEARAYADALEKHLKQPVVVANKPGGASTIGGNFVATSKPDGYTLGYLPIHTGIPEVFSYFTEAPYSSKDLRPICNVVDAITVAAVKAGGPWNSLREVVEFAKKNPGMKFGYNGKNTPPYMFAVMLDKQEKLGFVYVPFSGDSELLMSLLGDHIQFAAPIYPSVKAMVEGKKLKLLAAASRKRLEFAPDTPTVVELGYKVPPPSPHAVYGPKGTPNEVVKIISEATGKIVEQADFRARLNNLGTPINYQDAAAVEKYNAQLKEEIYTFFKEEGLVKK